MKKHQFENDCFFLPLSQTLSFRMDKDVGIPKLQVMHGANWKKVESLNHTVRLGFPVPFSVKQWKCHPTLTSFCFNSFEGKDVSVVKHGVTPYPCIISLQTIGEMI